MKFMFRSFVVAGMFAIAFSLLLAFSTEAQGEDWPKYMRDLANSGHSSETGINSSNVASLATKWTFTTGGLVSASPAVATVNGVSTVYVGSWNGIFYALNAVTGQQLWTFAVDLVGQCNATAGCRIGSSASVDVSNNLVFFGARNAYLYALNATTGQLVWKHQVGGKGYEVWSSPAVYGGRVYVGVSSHGDQPCIVGRVDAYDELTGNTAWSFNAIDQTTCPSGTCVGASVWSSVAIDAVNGIVYAGTGNPGSTCNPATANAALYPDSILALKADTGVLLNYFQAISNDLNDKDFGSSPVLHSTAETNECTNSSTQQYWVSEASKNGHFFTLERDANGLTGNVQDTFTNNVGFIATPAQRQTRTVTSCATSERIIDYVNRIYAPGAAGAFWTFYQSGTGTISLQAKNKVTPLPLFGAASVIQDVVFFGGNDDSLHAAGKYGKPIVTLPMGAAIYSGVAISNGRIYFGVTDGTIHCMSINGL